MTGSPRRLALALGLTLALCSTASTTRAADGPSEVDKDAARTLVQQGDDLMTRKDYEKALEAYRRADDIMGVPTTSIEVGKVSLLLDKLVEARAAFEKAASYPRRDDEPEPFTRARKEARKQLERVSPRIPRLSVSVRGLKDGDRAEVTLDDEPIETGEEIMLDPGSHQVAASASGYVTASEDLLLEEYDQRDVTLSLREAPTSLWPMVWAGYGVAGAGVIIGSITGGLSLRQANEVKRSCGNDPTNCPNNVPIDSSRTLAHVSTASFVIAGVAAGFGTAGLIISLTADDGEDGSEGTEAWLRLGWGSLGCEARF
jgi:hypothetical protein